jgi:8-oxo-dGTP pyrophosphatase MutT (NUDIX family)
VSIKTSPPVQACFAINVIEDVQNRLLLLQRATEAPLGPGRWGFVGGHIEEGESAEECSHRELEEELGPDLDLRLVGQIGPVRDSLYGGVFEVYLFHYRWGGGQIVLNAEHTRYVWVTRQEYRHYPVMDGIDEDIDYFGIWPRSYLNEDKLPG